jgi:drug/metabolite transporter (DMT)-like permease
VGGRLERSSTLAVVESSDDRARTDSPGIGVGLVLAAATLFAVNGTVSKLVLTSGLSSQRLVEIRCAGAAVVLCLAALARDRGSLRTPPRELGFVVAYGIVGVAMVQWLYFVALARIPVSLTLLIEFTAPLMVALWVRFVLRRPVRRRLWPALALVLAGLALVARVWAGLTVDGFGLVAAVVAACSLAAYYVMGEHGVASRDPVSLAGLSFAAAAVFWAAVQPWWTFPFGRLGDPVGVLGWPVPTWVLVLWVIVMGSVVPWVLVLTGLRSIGAARAGLVGTLEPVVASGVAWVVLGEALSPVQIAGGAVVVGGIVLAETARSARVAEVPTA